MEDRNMWNTRDEISPEEQNLTNHSQEAVGSTLDSFLRKPQQTYEDFVSNFTYLTIEDIEKAKNKTKHVITNPSETKLTSQTTSDTKTTCPPQDTDQKQESDELEEEILDDISCDIGILEPLESNSKNCTRKKLTQFDNFLSDDAVASDEEEYNLTKSEYLASFDSDSPQSVDKQGEKCNKNEPNIENSSHKNATLCKSSKLEEEQQSICESVIDSEVTPYQPDENGFLLNPGEVDEDFYKTSEAVVTNVTCLECASILCQPTIDKSCTETRKTEVENDSSDVIPFVLDEDFDYDNVVLSPKFSAAEMEYLNSIEKFTEDQS